ncbi:SGNH/GDSL hydrolase family protein [Phragmitibacter flavus]|uniref:SGNH/GDSL hydrolase family protein n=1 Tax=Phragmitibacter flavus TaxID=2576071 RepID=A0A5R8KEM0_9BACT|nr:SGNH/GDSL hydrolase family protein [Phragmitibacter flavus]TLD70039.1 SGNH/GDSL hydrolase family protein [Phragmitibacter flavus]
MIASVLRCSFLLALIAIGVTSLRANDYDLSPEQEERMKKFLPRTYAKLAKRNPVHVVSLGDSVMTMYGYGDEYNNTLLAYQTVFLNELSSQFYYPGGVRVIRPGKGKPEKLNEVVGVEITLQNLSRGGKLMFHALQPLTTQAFENKPDLVMVSFGINDATLNEGLEKYRKSLEEIIALVRANGADLLLFGPSLTVEDPPEELLALTRPYANAMREVAVANEVWFADLGDLNWFVRLDDRSAHLNAAKKEAEKRKAEEAKAQTETETGAPSPVTAPVHKSPVISPMLEQLDPDPEKRAAKLFNQVVDDYRKFFNHGEIVDWVHPDANFHRQLGKRIFKELLNGEKALPWKVSNSNLIMEGTKQCVLTYDLENTTKDEQTITLLPLVARHWKPLQAPTRLVLQPGKKTEVKITWLPRSEETFAGGMPFSDASICFSIMHANTEMVHINDIDAMIQPLAVVWDLGTRFNLENTVELQARVANTSKNPIKGTWEAAFSGQKWNGTFNAAGGEASPINLPFALPSTGATRLKGILTMTLVSEGLTYRFDRKVELSRNMGLKQEVKLVKGNPATDFGQPIDEKMPDADNPGVRFRADADSNALYLTWEVFGANMMDAPGGQPAYLIDTNIDARSYGKRLTPGATDSLRISGAAADGDGRVGALQPWVFGTGYAMFYDAKKVQAKLSSRPDGSRRISVALPRAYLYLHEWKIGNGNSQLGFNTYLSLWQKDAASPTGGAFETYFITLGGLHRDQVDALNVLELTDKPTNRWTMRLY